MRKMGKVIGKLETEKPCTLLPSHAVCTQTELNHDPPASFTHDHLQAFAHADLDTGGPGCLFQVLSLP